LLAAGCWLLVTGCWLLVAGNWLLVTGNWSLAVGYRYLFQVASCGSRGEKQTIPNSAFPIPKSNISTFRIPTSLAQT
jgi:hypothetical protein